MTSANVTIDVEGFQAVSGLLVRPPDAVACYVMAHGAGAGMEHSFMAACAIGLAAARSGRSDADVRRELLTALSAWIAAVV